MCNESYIFETREPIYGRQDGSSEVVEVGYMVTLYSGIPYQNHNYEKGIATIELCEENTLDEESLTGTRRVVSRYAYLNDDFNHPNMTD